MGIDGHTLVLGLIGDPVEHTLSPLIHNTFAKELEINSAYLPFHVQNTKGALEEAVRGAFRLGITGLNVTVPFKSEVIKFLASVDPLAGKIGAVNTLVRTEEGFRGYNTDILGLEKDLEQHGIYLGRQQEVLIIGAGGAARAAAFLCGERGIGRLYLINRSSGRAKMLSEDLHRYFPGMETVLLSDSDEDAEKLPAGITALQCTSAGLYPEVETLPVQSEKIYTRIGFAYDLIYTPSETAFLKKCVRDGSGYGQACGKGMLIFQAAASYELWMRSLGITVSIGSDIADIIQRKLSGRIGAAKRNNIILTGFMGSGKTTVGTELSRVLGMRFCDTDSIIEKREGRSISDIFNTSGEAYFRELETGLLRELSENSAQEGAIYSTGGGIVQKAENRELLHKAGTVIWLKAGAGSVIARLEGDDTRPLLQGTDKEEKVRHLLQAREPLYAEGADIVIDTDGLTVPEIAGQITDRIGYGGQHENSSDQRAES